MNPDMPTGSVQEVLSQLPALVPSRGLVAIDVFAATEIWKTIRIGVTVRGGGHAELLEDNGELCLMVPGSGAFPIALLLPNLDTRVPSVVLAFAVGAALAFGANDS